MGFTEGPVFDFSYYSLKLFILFDVQIEEFEGLAAMTRGESFIVVVVKTLFPFILPSLPRLIVE